MSEQIKIGDTVWVRAKVIDVDDFSVLIQTAVYGNRLWASKKEIEAEPTESQQNTLDAIERSGYDISPCRICGELVVCIPEGLPICRQCTQEAGG
jgi:hypothetical protein